MEILSRDTIEEIIRDLTKSNYYQTLYNQAKEVNIQLFQNIRDFTGLQVLFMSYLSFYNNLFTDILLDEVDELVLTDKIFEDAYMYYKRHSKPDYKQNKKDTDNLNKDTYIFKRKSK
jgi:hypothetical protein